MADKQIKGGDVVAWSMVPNGALVERERTYFVRTNKGGFVVGPGEWVCCADLSPWPWRDCDDSAVKPTIIAMGLTGQETADELQQLAERFEVRQFVFRIRALGREFSGQHSEDCADNLLRAGWKPGMTAEDAARLLSK